MMIRAESGVKERLVPAVEACSSLIKMQHQVSTGSQMLNEAGSPGTVVGRSATHPAR